MRYYRYMSYVEFEKILKGETLHNESQWRSVSDISLEENSTGFCFLREQVYSSFNYFTSPLHCYNSLRGIVDRDVLVCFEKLDEVQMKESCGQYSSLSDDYNLEYLDEYSIGSYSRDTFIPIGFYTSFDDIAKGFYTPIKIELPEDSANLKMLLIYNEFSLDFLEEHINEFDEECFRLCAAYQKLDSDFIEKHQKDFNHDAWYELIIHQKIPENIILSNFDIFEEDNLLDALLKSKNLTENIFDKINSKYSYVFQARWDDREHYEINSEGFSTEFILNHLERGNFSSITYTPKENPNGESFVILIEPELEERCKDIFMEADETFLRNFWDKMSNGHKHDFDIRNFEFFANFIENPNCKKIFREKFENVLDDEYHDDFDDFDDELLAVYLKILSPDEAMKYPLYGGMIGHLNRLVFEDGYDYSFLAKYYNDLPDYSKEVIISKYPTTINDYIESCIKENKMFNIGALYSSYFKNSDFTMNDVFDKALNDVCTSKSINYDYLKNLITYNCKNFELNGTMLNVYEYKKMYEKDLFVKYIYAHDNYNLDFLYTKEYIEQNKEILTYKSGEDIWRNLYKHKIEDISNSQFIASNLHKLFKLSKNDDEKRYFFEKALPIIKEFLNGKNRYGVEVDLQNNYFFKNLCEEYFPVKKVLKKSHKYSKFDPNTSDFVGRETAISSILKFKKDNLEDTLFIKIYCLSKCCEYEVYPTREELIQLLEQFKGYEDFFKSEVCHQFRPILRIPDLDTSFIFENILTNKDCDFHDVVDIMKYLKPSFISENFNIFKELLKDSSLSRAKLNGLKLEEDLIISEFKFFEEKGVAKQVIAMIDDKESFFEKCPQARNYFKISNIQHTFIYPYDKEHIIIQDIFKEAINKYLETLKNQSFNLQEVKEDFNYEGFEAKRGMYIGVLDTGEAVVVSNDFSKDGRIVTFVKYDDSWEIRNIDINTSNFYIEGVPPAFCKISDSAIETTIKNGEINYVPTFINGSFYSFYENDENIFYRIENTSNVFVFNKNEENGIVKKDLLTSSNLNLDGSPLSIAIVNEILKENNEKEIKNLLNNIQSRNVSDEILKMVQERDISIELN